MGCCVPLQAEGLRVLQPPAAVSLGLVHVGSGVQLAVVPLR